MKEGHKGRYINSGEVGIFIARVPAYHSARQLLNHSDWKVLSDKQHKEIEKYNRIVYMEHSGDMFMTNEKYWRFDTGAVSKKPFETTGTVRRFLRQPGKIDEASGMTLF